MFFFFYNSFNFLYKYFRYKEPSQKNCFQFQKLYRYYSSGDFFPFLFFHFFLFWVLPDGFFVGGFIFLFFWNQFLYDDYNIKLANRPVHFEGSSYCFVLHWKQKLDVRIRFDFQLIKYKNKKSQIHPIIFMWKNKFSLQI